MDPEAFSKKLVSLQSSMLHFAYSLTANRDDAYDLLQDTTLKALDNRDKYIDNTNFKGWVFTIMRNIFINNYRRVVRNQTVVDQSDDLHLLNVVQDSGLDTPEGVFAMHEINKCINSFNAEYREPFSLDFATPKPSRKHTPPCFFYTRAKPKPTSALAPSGASEKDICRNPYAQSLRQQKLCRGLSPLSMSRAFCQVSPPQTSEKL